MSSGLKNILNFIKHCETPCIKVVGIRTFSGPYFPIFGLNMEIYRVYIHNQSEYMKKQTRKKSVFGHLLLSDVLFNKLCENRLISEICYRVIWFIVSLITIFNIPLLIRSIKFLLLLHHKSVWNPDVSSTLSEFLDRQATSMLGHFACLIFKGLFRQKDISVIRHERNDINAKPAKMQNRSNLQNSLIK